MGLPMRYLCLHETLLGQVGWLGNEPNTTIFDAFSLVAGGKGRRSRGSGRNGGGIRVMELMSAKCRGLAEAGQLVRLP